ncbi:hypothetical protein Pelo_2442 [Pelomyxa schiedti]|nr:hypothetical protein Pelo_2442 [Pelomyxa schiedti]
MSTDATSSRSTESRIDNEYDRSKDAESSTLQLGDSCEALPLLPPMRMISPALQREDQETASGQTSSECAAQRKEDAPLCGNKDSVIQQIPPLADSNLSVGPGCCDAQRPESSDQEQIPSFQPRLLESHTLLQTPQQVIMQTPSSQPVTGSCSPLLPASDAHTQTTQQSYPQFPPLQEVQITQPEQSGAQQESGTTQDSGAEPIPNSTSSTPLVALSGSVENSAIPSFTQIDQGAALGRPQFMHQVSPNVALGLHAGTGMGYCSVPPNEDQEMFTLRLRHQKVLFWTGAIWHEYRDVRRLKLIRPAREVSIPDPSTLMNQGISTPPMQPVPPSSFRYIRTTTSFKGQVSHQKILSRRSTHDSEDDINLWPEVYFINDAWYYYQPQSSMILLDENWKGETIEVTFPLIQCECCKEYATPQKKFQEQTVGAKKKFYCSRQCMTSFVPSIHPSITPAQVTKIPHHRTQQVNQQMYVAHQPSHMVMPPSHNLAPQHTPMRMPMTMIPSPVYYSSNPYQLVPAQQNEEVAAQQLVGLSDYTNESVRKRPRHYTPSDGYYSKRPTTAVISHQTGIPMLMIDPESQALLLQQQQQNLEQMSAESPQLLQYYCPQQPEYQTFAQYDEQQPLYNQALPPPPPMPLEHHSLHKNN